MQWHIINRNFSKIVIIHYFPGTSRKPDDCVVCDGHTPKVEQPVMPHNTEGQVWCSQAPNDRSMTSCTIQISLFYLYHGLNNFWPSHILNWNFLWFWKCLYRPFGLIGLNKVLSALIFGLTSVRKLVYHLTKKAYHMVKKHNIWSCGMPVSHNTYHILYDMVCYQPWLTLHSHAHMTWHRGYMHCHFSNTVI